MDDLLVRQQLVTESEHLLYHIVAKSEAELECRVRCINV